MKKSSVNWHWWQIGLLITGFYTLLTMFFIPRLFFYTDFNSGFQGLLLFSLANYLWVAFTPIVFLAGRWFPIISPRITKNLVVHFCFSLVVALGFTVIYVSLVQLFRNEEIIISGIPANFVINTVTNSFIYYVGNLAVHQALFYSHKYREREFLLQQAELQALKMQLQPHFLFNTLNAISALVYVSPKNAIKTISQLSDLLRLTLNSSKTQEITLKEELDFLRRYVQIQQTLLEERLKVEWKIEPETLDAAIPNMLLQPLIENSIRHGIAPLEKGGLIEIKTRRDKETLFICVRDNGLGIINAAERKNFGVGLSNTKARLRYLYEGRHEFNLSEPLDGGLSVSISIPFRDQISEKLFENSKNA